MLMCGELLSSAVNWLWESVAHLRMDDINFSCMLSLIAWEQQGKKVACVCLGR